MDIPVYKINLPEYKLAKRPDFRLLGQKTDNLIKKHFLGQNIVIRCLSSAEHQGKSANQLIKIIKKLGTDRYDLQIPGDRYDNLANKKIDFFALDFKVTPQKEIMKNLLEPFYDYPIQTGRQPIKIDLIIIYDRLQLKMVIHTYDNKRKKRDGFIFKDPKNKIKSLKGIIKIF